MNKLLIVAMFLLLGACKTNSEKSDAFGNFEVNEVLVSFESNGRILSLNFEIGDRIEKNQLLGVVDTINLKLQMKQVDANKALIQIKKRGVDAKIATLKQQKANLRKSYDRVAILVKDGAATQQQYDDLEGAMALVDRQIGEAEVQYQTIRSELNSANVKLELLNDQLDKCKITSAIEGVVLEKYAEKGELAIAGKSVCKLAPMDFLNLRCYVSGSQLSQIKLGEMVNVFIDAPDDSMKSYRGKVFWISSEAEFSPKIIQTKEERVKLVYAVKIKVANDGSLKIGMPAEVRF